MGRLLRSSPAANANASASTASSEAASVTPPATTSRQALPSVAAGKRPRKYAASRAASEARNRNSDTITSALAAHSAAPAPTATSSAAHQPGTPAAEKYARLTPTIVMPASQGAQTLSTSRTLAR